jgi:DNA end-binding protein Ku
MKDLAAHIIDSKAAHFDPEQFDDRYEEAVAELLKSKQAGKPMKDVPSEKASNVVNLMDALKRSVAAEKAGSADTKAAPPKKAAAKSKVAKKPAAGTKARKAG